MGRAWNNVTATRTGDEVFEKVAREVLVAPPTQLPAKESTVGNSSVTWFETEPGVAAIFTYDGSVEDQHLARTVVRSELEAHGYRQAQFTVDGSKELRKLGHWNDIMAKAKRLVQAGNVQITRNAPHTVMSHVQGDNGNYECTISREDPSSRAFTQWKCTCPWDQFAWQRTRKWKKYEGRVCSHVLATYWQALSTPLDEEIDPKINQGPPPTIPDAGAPSVESPALPEAGGGPPSADSPMADPAAQTVPMQGPVTPYQAPPAAQPAAPDVLPQFQDPNAVQAPPPVSVEGVQGPTPENPIQYPGSMTPGPYGGGTLSGVEHGGWVFQSADFVQQPSGFQNGNIVSLNQSDYGVAEGKSEAHGSGQYRQVNKGSIGEVMGQDPTTGLVEVIYPLHDSGPMEPYHVRMHHFPSEITLRPDIPRPGPFRKRVR